MNGATCDPWLQDCPEGQKCVAYQSVGDTWDANKCVDVLGDNAAGDPCTYAGKVEATDDCDAESWCFDVDGDLSATCVAFCTGTADSPVCPPNSECSIANTGSINICLPTCNPLLQDCPGAQGCYWDSTHFVCADSNGPIPEGDPCGFIADCAPGLVCVTADTLPSCDGASCCSGWCDLLDPSCGIAGTECTPWFAENEAPPGFENVGVCAVPGG